MSKIDDFLDERKLNIEFISVIRWFLEHTLDNYLDQNASTLLKAIRNDEILPAIKEFMLDYEITHKNRKDVVEALNE